MINVSQAFHRTSANPVDETMALTKAQMLTVNDNLMPAYYFTICQDDGEIYLYDKTATPSSTTGKFTKFEGGGGGGGTGEGVVITKTLLAAGWNGNHQQSLTFDGYNADMGGVIGVPTNATASQKEAYADSVINVVSQSGNVFTFEYETVPTIDLPVTLYAGGSGGGSAEFPSGGTTGQALVKKSNADNDVEWGTIESEQIQYSTMPTASATNVGQIVQFTGATDATYTNGLFYECVNNSGTYSWVQKDVQSYPETDLTNVFASGFPTASVSGARPFSYSTDEKIVGTWINGKPIYEITFSENITTAGNVLFDMSPYNTEVCMKCSGTIKQEPSVGSGSFVEVPYYTTESDMCIIWFAPDDKIYGRSTVQGTVYITVRYTKTT